MRISFGPFAFDRQSRLLWREGAEVALPPRVLGVLEILIDRQGQVVARQDLMDAVWKDAFVTDTSLAEAVSFLRQALGDDPQAPRYIQTVHRRGYRFLAPLTPLIEDRGLTPDPAGNGAERGLTPKNGFVTASGDRVEPATVPPSIGWQILPWSVATLCAVLALALGWRTISEPPAEAPPVARFEIRSVDGTSFAPVERRAPSLAVSPDGRVLTWVACSVGSGGCVLYARPIDRLEAAPLAGTEGAVAPFFSPDGRWIAFFADGRLKKIPSAGGSPSVLADAPWPGGGSWGPGGQIVFSGAPAGGLSLVSDQGGPVAALTMPDAHRGELRHLLPAWLPGGTAIAFTVAESPLADGPSHLAVVSLRAKTWKTLRSGVTRALAAGPGYLLLSSGDDLQAVTFDESTLTVTGGGDSMLASLTARGGISQFAIGGGTLIAFEAPHADRFTWTDRPDREAAGLARLSSVALAPDARRAAGVIADGTGSDIWVADLASGALTRITYGGINVSPAWSADGQQIYFASRTATGFTIAARAVDDRSDLPLASPSWPVFPTSVAGDGRIAATIVQPAVPAGRTSVGILAPTGGTPRVVTDGPFDESAATFSPDGQWLALESDESGRREIVVRDLRDGRRFPVSTGGGTQPRWSADGRTLYFDSGRRLMRAGFDPSREPHGQRPEVVFDRADARVVAVTPNGRLLVRQQSGPSNAIVILQWLRELRQRMPLPVTAPR